VIPFCGCPSSQMDDFPTKICCHCLLGNTTSTSANCQTPNIWGSWLCRMRCWTSDSYNMGAAAHLSPLSKPGMCYRVEKPSWAFTQYSRISVIFHTSS
jgi:hypothetical protein